MGCDMGGYEIKISGTQAGVVWLGEETRDKSEGPQTGAGCGMHGKRRDE